MAKFVEGERLFCFTYGDGVADVDISKLIAFHLEHGKLATVMATRPLGRFGSLRLGKSGVVEAFEEKTEGVDSWINGGFFVLSPKVIERIDGDATSWEVGPLDDLAADGELMAYTHDGFWQPMDTLRDKRLLEHLWAEGKAPWKVW